jgi:hypothetical protein
MEKGMEAAKLKAAATYNAAADHFDDGPLAGTKLVGFCLWKSPEGEVYVTFPSRAFGAGSERRYFDYLRAVDASGETIKRVKAWILDEYRKVEAAA